MDDAGRHWRAAVNVLSQESPSELLFAAADPFRHPVLAALPASAAGWAPVPSAPGGAALDLIRGNVVDPSDLRPVPPDVAGPDNDLADRLDQSWHTDDTTGHALDQVPPGPPPAGPAAPVRIIAALANPAGPAPEAETVTLVNVSDVAIDVGGWRLADRMKRAGPLPDVAIPPGRVLVVHLPQTVQLGNDGGAITLLDAGGLKVHGVVYTREQARREGWTITF